MKYIELAEGISVRIEDIESVSKGEDDLTSIVKTQYNIYKSTFPYGVLLELLESNQEPEDKSREEEMNILKQIGVFSG